MYVLLQILYFQTSNSYVCYGQVWWEGGGGRGDYSFLPTNASCKLKDLLLSFVRFAFPYKVRVCPALIYSSFTSPSQTCYDVAILQVWSADGCSRVVDLKISEVHEDVIANG